MGKCEGWKASCRGDECCGKRAELNWILADVILKVVFLLRKSDEKQWGAEDRDGGKDWNWKECQWKQFWDDVLWIKVQSKSLTVECCRGRGEVGDQSVAIIDSPGLFSHPVFHGKNVRGFVPVHLVLKPWIPCVPGGHTAGQIHHWNNAVDAKDSRNIWQRSC